MAKDLHMDAPAMASLGGTLTSTGGVNSSQNQRKDRKKKKRKKKQSKAVEHEGPHFSLVNSCLKTDATIEEVNPSQGKSGEHKDEGPHFSVDNSSPKTDATTEEVNSLRKQERAGNKKKQGKDVELKDKGPNFSLDNSSLKIDATLEEVKSPQKWKKEREKQQVKAVEQIDQGPHLLVANFPLKIDVTTEEIHSLGKKEKSRKKKERGKDVELEDKGPNFSLDNSSLKIYATSEEVNSPQKRKRERKKKKQYKPDEHKDKGPHVSLVNSSLKIDATTEEVNPSHGKAVEHKDKGPYFSVDNSSQKTGANIEDPLHESPALPNLLSSQRIVELNSTVPTTTTAAATTTKSCPTMWSRLYGLNDAIVSSPVIDHVVCPPKKRRKRQKTKHDASDNTFSSNTCAPALHVPSEHLIQFMSTDRVARQSCLEIDICQEEHEEKEQFVSKTAAESSKGECHVQEVSCSRNSVVSNAECFTKESVLEVVKFNICQEENVEKEQCVPKKAAERSSGECHFQEVSCSHNSVASNAECSANEFVLEVVKLNQEQGIINYSSNHKGRSDILENDCLAKKHDDYGKNSCYPSPVGRTITSNSKKKLLILDVNGLLADFVISVPRGSKPPDFVLRGKKVYKRPFCCGFLWFCFQRFHVGVWSSRVKYNLDKAVKFLFGRSASQLLFCWSRSECSRTKYNTPEDKHKPLVFKELRKLWDKTVPGLPWEKGEFNESNTLLVDDSPYKALLNPRCTAIFPHSYHYDNPHDKSLGRGGDIRVYLEGLAEAENVQEYVSSNPFGQEAITKTNPFWDFYSEVVEAVKRGRETAARNQAAASKWKGCRQSSATTDQVNAGLPPSCTGDPQQTEAAPPSATGDPPRKAKVAPLSGTGGSPQQIKAPPPPATGDPPQQTKAPLPPVTKDPPQLTSALPPPATQDLPRRTKVPLHPASLDPPQQTKASPPAARDVP